MGLHDAEEMLEAAKAQAILDEREAARLRAELDAAGLLVADQARQLQEQASVLFQAGEQHGILWRERYELEQKLDAVRTLAREPVSLRDSEDAHYDVVEVHRILEIVGAQPSPSADEHDRTA